MHEGSCHCGAIRMTLPSAPEVATDCNCSKCRRIGGPWVYFEFGTVKIEADPEAMGEYMGRQLSADRFLQDMWMRHPLGAAGANARLQARREPWEL